VMATAASSPFVPESMAAERDPPRFPREGSRNPGSVRPDTTSNQPLGSPNEIWIVTRRQLTACAESRIGGGRMPESAIRICSVMGRVGRSGFRPPTLQKLWRQRCRLPSRFWYPASGIFY